MMLGRPPIWACTQTIDELGRAGLAFGVKTIESRLEAFEINPRGILVRKQQAQIVGIIQPRHDDQRLAIDHAMLRDIGPGQVAGPENSFVNEVAARCIR